jgi:hypothetical protein
MSMKTVLQIVPRLPPAVCGVGDYAFRLAVEWRKQYKIETKFMVLDPCWDGRPALDGFRVQRLEKRTPNVFLRVLDAMEAQESRVLLHYVGYGYARRGAPVWLAIGMRRWLKARPKCVAGIFFHELVAFGPPWTSAFWLHPLQRWVCRDLARAARLHFTNRTASAKKIDEMVGGVNPLTISLPVFSNLEEPTRIQPLAERLPQMVVYGPTARSKPLQLQALRWLQKVCQQTGVQKIISFGVGSWDQHGLSVPVENRGMLSAAEVSALLTTSQLGYIDYPLQFATKSTIFAAYCAHGLVPVLLQGDATPVDGLRLQENFITAAEFPSYLSSENGLQAIATNARRWYSGHCIAKVSGTIGSRLLV